MASVPPASSPSGNRFYPSGFLLSDLLPATVLCVRNPNSIPGKSIEIGEALLGLPDSTHIAMVHHTDDKGTLWCLEARPGGVGWRDARAYLASPFTVANVSQPLLATVRTAIATEAVSMIGTDYDWIGGIAEDAFRDLGIESKWGEHWDASGTPPAHVVCSSYLAYLYAHSNQPVPLPADLPHTEPGDWVSFILSHHYNLRTGTPPATS